MKQTPRSLLWQAKVSYNIARPVEHRDVKINENASISGSVGYSIARPMKQAPRGGALTGKSKLKHSQANETEGCKNK